MNVSTTAEPLASLVDFSLESLETMYQTKAGLFCSHRDTDGRKFGVSPRYSLICLIGMHRARSAGLDVPYDLELLLERVLEHPAHTSADAGLRLWAAALCAPRRGTELATALASQLGSQNKSELTGMHAGLALSGLTVYAEASGDLSAIGQADELRNRIIEEYTKSPSGLFYHSPPGTIRRSKPNFATQVYLIHGLARESMLSGNPLGADVSEECAQTLASLQRGDGGWPWIYDTSGAVVEDYEIYSVHQDAMAPMAFLALEDAGRSGFLQLVDRGLEWLIGRNDLSLDMVDRDHRIIFRSIRRPRPFNRLALMANTASAEVLRRSPLHAKGRVELNATYRPYHAGWILEAWSERIAESTGYPSR